jgi:hypothetical protein
MSLSVCLITKNEEKNIARALRSVKKIADEVIVADTGSTDKTVEIATGLGAQVYNFPWIDDFSAARNFAISQAHSDWIFWLDADEELLPESQDEVLQCLQRRDALAYLVLRLDLQRVDESDYGTEMWQLRLFRRCDDLKFQGRCHPDFRPSIDAVAKARGQHVYQSNIRLRHYGYLAHLKKSKLERAAKLLNLELQDRPGQLYYEIEYGRTLLLLGDETGYAVLRDATKRMLEKQHDPTPPQLLASALIEYLLVTPTEKSQCPLDTTQLHELAERWFPDAAPLLWLRAQNKFQSQDFESASRLLERLVRHGRKGTYDKSTSFDPHIIGDDASLNLAACYIRLGKLTEAEPLLAKLLSSPTLGAQARQNLDAVRELRRQFKQKS